MKRSTEIVSTIAWCAVMTGILLSVIFALAFNRGFYSYEYQKGDQAASIGMSDKDLMKATDTLLDYLENKRDNIRVTAEISGTKTEVFNERETLHMVDVKNLYQNAVHVRNILLVCGIVILIFLCVKNRNQWHMILSEGYRHGMTLILLVVVFILIWAVADFYDFWMDFHYLFFDNDLFLLDPNTSIMINMFPETFFSDLVILIIVVYGLSAAAIGVVLHLVNRHFGKKVTYDQRRSLSA